MSSVILNPSAEKFIPKWNAQSLPNNPMKFDPSAEEFIPKWNAQSLPNNPMKYNPSAKEFIPKWNAQQSLPNNPMKFNPCAEEFVPQSLSNSSGDFTTARNLQRHTQCCMKGESEVCCLVEADESPQAAYERAFYPWTNASRGSILWLEYLSTILGRHIHHALCGHGGERWIAGAPVDGYEPCTRTVYQYHGCHCHGCPTHCQRDDASALFEKTHRRDQKIRDAGYELVVVWQCQRPLLHGADRVMPKSKTEIYPHGLVFDFKAHIDNTGDLAHEKTHVPRAVSVGDSLSPQPTHICDRDPAALIAALMAELQRRADLLRADVEGTFLPDDLDLLPQGQQQKIRDWCRLVPVLGLNSGRYDLYGPMTFSLDCGVCKECSELARSDHAVTPPREISEKQLQQQKYSSHLYSKMTISKRRRYKKTSKKHQRNFNNKNIQKDLQEDNIKHTDLQE